MAKCVAIATHSILLLLSSVRKMMSSMHMLPSMRVAAGMLSANNKAANKRTLTREALWYKKAETDWVIEGCISIARLRMGSSLVHGVPPNV
jgi:hypothetical protein